MDPWTICSESRLLTSENIDISEKSRDSFSFEDNFRPLVSDTLPDSKEYLAILENKLNKLKSDPNVLRQLSEKREACMQQLLSGISSYSESTEEESLKAPVTSSTILRTLAPEKQALTVGERVELVKYDQLVEEEFESEHTDHSETQPQK